MRVVTFYYFLRVESGKRLSGKLHVSEHLDTALHSLHALPVAVLANGDSI